MSRTLEICVEAPRDAVLAAEAGAHRVELAVALDLGGLTPSAGLVEETVALSPVPVMVLLRPRPGSFQYREDELAAMVRDARHAAGAKAHGIVVGPLDDDGMPHMEALKALREAAGPLEITFHRAFDQCPDKGGALQKLASLKIERILTSGGLGAARDGAQNMAALVAASTRLGGPRIMTGGGLKPLDVPRLEREAGVFEFHASAARVVREDGPCAAAQLATGRLLKAGEHRRVDASIVRSLLNAGL